MNFAIHCLEVIHSNLTREGKENEMDYVVPDSEHSVTGIRHDDWVQNGAGRKPGNYKGWGDGEQTNGFNFIQLLFFQELSSFMHWDSLAFDMKEYNWTSFS